MQFVKHDRGVSIDLSDSVEKLTLENCKFELSSIYRVSSCNSELRDIEEAKYLTNLSIFSSYDSNITDVNPLSSLNNLRVLILKRNPVSDISCLKNLNSLTELSVSYTNVTDISCLSRLTNLSNLRILGSKIIDYSVLEKMKLNNLTISDDDRMVTVNLYKLNVGGEFCTPEIKMKNYIRRVKLSSRINIVIRRRIMNLWFLFLEQELDSSGYNRLSFLSYN